MDKQNAGSVSEMTAVKKVRSSNLELFRIITMLFIVAHHYVVNSGLSVAGGPIAADPTSWRSLFLLVFGAFGKTGINCFVLITGYFMCKSQITAKKFAKLLLEVMFYNIVIYLIFLCSGYTDFSIVSLAKALLPITSISHNFTGCFILFYLCIPFLNILVQRLSEKQHLYLLLLLSFIYVFFGTVKVLELNMNYISWYIVLYFVASYIRIYPKKIFDSQRIWGFVTLVCVALSSISVLACAILGAKINWFNPFFFVTDSNTFLALTTGLSAFMFFKNMKMKYHPVINTIAASAFGVLLIHANSGTMRQWLWRDTLNNVGMYSSDLLIFHAIGSVIGIYIICTLIDYLRIHSVEKGIFILWDKYWDRVVVRYKALERKICQKLHIKEDENP